MFIEPKQFRISVSSKLNTSGPMSTRLNRPIFLTLVNRLCTMPQIRLKVKQSQSKTHKVYLILIFGKRKIEEDCRRKYEKIEKLDY